MKRVFAAVAIAWPFIDFCPDGEFDGSTRIFNNAKNIGEAVFTESGEAASTVYDAGRNTWYRLTQ